MQYNTENEKVFVGNTSYSPLPNRSLLTHDPQVKRTRKILIVILGVCLALSVISLVSAVFENNLKAGGVNTQRGTQTSHALISILFYAFGVFAAHRYSALALRIFGVLVIIASVVLGLLLGLILILAIVAVFAPAYVRDNENRHLIATATVAMVISAVVLIVNLIVSIIIARLTFQLVRLIDSKKSLIVQQI